MKLFVNAVNLSSAGGLNVALNFLKGVATLKPDDLHVYVAAPRHCGYEALATEAIHLYFLPRGSGYWVSRLYIDYRWVPSLIDRIKPDIIFTMGNFATPVPGRQAVLLHYPHPAYPDEVDIWNRLDLFGKLNVWMRNQVFSRRIHYTDVLLVQTETIRQRIRQVYPDLPAIALLPNAYTTLRSQTTYALPFVKQLGFRYLMCLSRYYPHKNLEVLLDVARLIRDRNMPYRLLLTIEPTQHRKARRLLDQIERLGLTTTLINIGHVPATGIYSLHQQVDGLVLPTLLESFTATYVDALHFGLPIFTSRRDFSEEVCGDCAYYFDPLSAEDILDTIHAGFSNPFRMQRNIDRGRQRSAQLPDWPAVVQMGLESLYALGPESQSTLSRL
ncbi:glycosyltransferase [Fibrisoma montanum]|uniref:Glycosyltransferase n=1 Tax=Fibrisoma montanum TaxID=2305895 RepID=A0A418M144_9BACT|nr:glycosyltransferase [Fibrisoma montanum]RIV19387.1 glycosyltransferase [Fibrisoma montanum]